MLADAGGTLAGLVAKLQQDERTSGRKVLAPSELPRNRRSTVDANMADQPISPETTAAAR
ncbi:MAG: hypothetical protein JSS02_33065 [Planctomycetes bacterium]|nr:hypothetical protein [Planctomycetota bacterium]